MKRLIMCEGPNELTLINILLENDRVDSSLHIGVAIHNQGNDTLEDADGC